MEKCTGFLDNKYVLMVLIVVSVLTVYLFGKAVGELANYLVH